MPHSVVFPMSDLSRVGEARRFAAVLAQELGFDEALAGKVAIVVSEAATNLVRHGAGGELHVVGRRAGLRAGGDPNPAAPALLEILAIDKGPGIGDLPAAMRDGFSTGGTAGAGLGAIERLSTSFDIYSPPSGGGTVVVARFSPRQPAAAPGTAPAANAPWLLTGAVTVPHPSEQLCGDAWAAEVGPDRALFMIADGLGHGPDAAAAADAAVQVFREHASRTAPTIMQHAHAALRSTRGAAIGIAEVDRAAGVVRYAGVGNIVATVLATGAAADSPPGGKSLISYNGIVGHEMRKVQEVSLPWNRDSVLVMHSDGLQTSWKLDRYPGLTAHDPSLAAAVLYRDFTRGRDDVTVVVAREELA